MTSILLVVSPPATTGATARRNRNKRHVGNEHTSPYYLHNGAIPLWPGTRVSGVGMRRFAQPFIGWISDGHERWHSCIEMSLNGRWMKEIY